MRESDSIVAALTRCGGGFHASLVRRGYCILVRVAARPVPLRELPRLTEQLSAAIMKERMKRM